MAVHQSSLPPFRPRRLPLGPALVIIAAFAVAGTPVRAARGRSVRAPALPALSINPAVNGAEGGPGLTTPLFFAVTLSAPSSQTVTVNYGTAEGSPAQCAQFHMGCAQANKDFVPAAGLLVFAPGETVKIIRVSIVNDDLQEPNEIFFA